MLRSTMKTVSAPTSSSFRGSLPHPTQPLCTLRVRRRRRLTQHSLPGGSLGLTWAGLAPADRASFAWRLPSIDQIASEPPNQERVAGYRIDEDQSGVLAQPGRNVTGTSMMVPEVAARRLNLLTALAAS